MVFLLRAVISGMCLSFGRDVYDWAKEKLADVEWNGVVKRIKEFRNEIEQD